MGHLLEEGYLSFQYKHNDSNIIFNEHGAVIIQYSD